ncbi:MAG TPA: D-Ala-D-Ala carboxypeptidase family metallohydrolase, partial [Salinarimonas sp.]|nr:D-Ala-D-Ala carboxypeptidase family metallohydrolase [Salinarimonas sp.]
MRLTPYFSLDEFDCHDGNQVPKEYIANVEHLVVKVLQPLRELWGPLIVVSGWRSQDWNTRVGGAKASTHLTGEGADVRPVRLRDVPEFLALIEARLKAGGLPELGGL